MKSIGFLGASALPVGVEFGCSALRVLALAPPPAGDPAADAPVLQGAASVDTPPDCLDDPAKRLEFQTAELLKLVKTLGIKGRRAMCAIPAPQTFCKHAQFPKSDAAALRMAVSGLVSSEIGCHPDALIYRPIEVPDAVNNSGKSEVICLAAARAFVGRLMDAMRKAGLEPVGIHPEYSAVVRAFDHITRRTEDDAVTSLYIDLGYGQTKVAIAHGKDLVFARGIPFGGRHLDDSVAHQCKLSFAEAHARRLNATRLTLAPAPAGARPAAEAPATGGGLAMLAAGMAKEGVAPTPAQSGTATDDRRRGGPAPGHDVLPDDAVDLGDSLEMLTDDIAMCIRYHESVFPGRPIDRTIFVGGEARQRPLCQHIARALRLPAQVADPLARLGKPASARLVNTDPASPQPGWAVCVGLCLSPTDL